MPTKYVWWDDRRKDPPTRMQLRVPKSLKDFTHEIADIHGISVNAFIVALLEHAYTCDEARQLAIEVGPNLIRVTPKLTPPMTPDLTPQSATPDRRFPYAKGKVR